MEALEEARDSMRVDPNGRNAWLVAFYLIPLGERDEAMEWLSIAEEDFRAGIEAGRLTAAGDAFDLASLLSYIGERDKTFEWLDICFDLRSVRLVDLWRRAYRFEEIWGDERYEALMRRRGFPEEIIENLRPAPESAS